MFTRAYLRASTKEQDANRARTALDTFASDNGLTIACYYVEHESGTKLDRPELMRLLSDSKQGDTLLIEQIDRLSRLNNEDWQTLRRMIADKGVNIVALDMPTSHMMLNKADTFTDAMLTAINGMLLDMLAAIARKDFEDRRRRTAEGIEKAKRDGKYKGRQIDTDKHRKIIKLLSEGQSWTTIQDLLGCSRSTIKRVCDLQKQETDQLAIKY
jgi:DNA invertase Pin-like site-specific DNA recombinase